MQIKGLFIAGIPARIVRDAMRRACQRDAFTHDLFVEECKVTEHRAREIIKALVAGNFIEVAKRPRWADRERRQWYKATAEGLRLSNATGLRRMPRSKADAMLADFLKRVQQVNTHPEYIYCVSTVIVSGSYARDENTLGDLDIFYGLGARFADSDRDGARQDRIDAAKQKGRRFSNIVEELYWDQREVDLHLKARTRGLSLHRLDEFFTMEKDERFAYKVLLGDAKAIATKLTAGMS
jgi:hypothetical protein